MAGLYDYPGILKDIPQGTTVPLEFTFTDDELTPIDITDYSLQILLAAQLGDEPDLVINLPVGNAGTGVFVGEISDEQTAELLTGTYFYTIKYTKPDGRTYIIDMGKIKVLGGV